MAVAKKKAKRQARVLYYTLGQDGSVVPVRKTNGDMRFKPSIVDDLIKNFENGCNIQTACQLTGIATSTFGNWRYAAETLEREQPAGWEKTLDWKFWVKVMKARAVAKRRNLVLIQGAAQDGNWNAAAWWLERSFPKEFGRVSTHEVTGANGSQLQTGVVAVISDEALDDDDTIQALRRIMEGKESKDNRRNERQPENPDSLEDRTGVRDE